MDDSTKNSPRSEGQSVTTTTSKMDESTKNPYGSERESITTTTCKSVTRINKNIHVTHGTSSGETITHSEGESTTGKG